MLMLTIFIDELPITDLITEVMVSLTAAAVEKILFNLINNQKEFINEAAKQPETESTVNLFVGH